MMDVADILKRQILAGARAMGMLCSLVDQGYIPAHHLAHARAIIAEWEATLPQPQPEAHDESL